MELIRHYDSPIGGITLAGEGERLTGLWFDGQKHYAETLSGEHREGDLPVLSQAIEWLDVYFSGRPPEFTPPLRLRSTPFREEVWEILRTIPFGKTMTYGQIAALIAARRGRGGMSAQAVGGAVGRNPISLIVPCHRVIGADGSLTGYAGGIERKRWLLALESRKG